MPFNKILRALLMILVVSFLIFFHELGHFASCKLFGIRAPVFSLGFGPALIKKQIGQTEFQISMLPFGGYVSMNIADLNQAAYWQKMILTLSGVFNNFLLSWLLLLVVFFIDKKKHLPFFESIVPQAESDNHTIVKVISRATKSLFYMIKRSFYFITRIFQPKKQEQPYDPHPVFQMLHQKIRGKCAAFCVFVAALSVELGVFNLLPIPMLDGGQALNYSLEAFAHTFFPRYDQIIIHFLYIMLFVGILIYLNRRAAKNPPSGT